jgi:hypothetical protein
MDILLSQPLLRAVYAAPLLACLPPRFGDVVRARMERAFARHPNRTTSYARALLLGELGDEPVPPAAGGIHLVQTDARLSRPFPKASTSLSNILDGVEDSPPPLRCGEARNGQDAVMVLRLPVNRPPLPTNRALKDRAMLWEWSTSSRWPHCGRA